MAPLLVNADEVIGTGTPSAPNGAVQHPVRFTVNHMLNYWVWPGTESAGTSRDNGSTSNPQDFAGYARQAAICRERRSGSTASVATPACAATSPQAAIIITGFRNYGIILADNGDSGGLIGTPDARWSSADLA